MLHIHFIVIDNYCICISLILTEILMFKVGTVIKKNTLYINLNVEWIIHVQCRYFCSTNNYLAWFNTPILHVYANWWKSNICIRMHCPYVMQFAMLSCRPNCKQYSLWSDLCIYSASAITLCKTVYRPITDSSTNESHTYQYGLLQNAHIQMFDKSLVIWRIFCHFSL